MVVEVKRKWFQHITIEPTVALYYFVVEIMAFLNGNLLLQKSCHSNATSEILPHPPCINEKVSEQYVAKINSWRYPLHFYLAICFTSIGAMLCDIRNIDKKWLVFIPIFGKLLTCVFLILNSYFWTLSPVIAALSDSFGQGLTGGVLCVGLGSQLYISSITSHAERSTRIGLLMALKYIFYPLGACVAGFLNTSLGFINSYIICLVITIISLSMGLIMVKNVSTKYNRLEGNTPKTFINPIKSLITVFRKRPNNRRIVLLSLLLIDVLHLFPMLGEQTVMYLYLRYRFGWQENEYSLYTAYKMMGTLSGTLFCTIFLSKYLKIHDGFIGTLAAFWDTVGNISYFYADKTWELYVIPLYNIFNGVLFAMMASLSTKCVDHNEMGYLTSVRSLMQIVSPLSFPLYGLIYKATIDSLPNAFFLLSMAFNFPTIILFAISYYLSKDIKFEDAKPEETAIEVTKIEKQNKF